MITKNEGVSCVGGLLQGVFGRGNAIVLHWLQTACSCHVARVCLGWRCRAVHVRVCCAPTLRSARALASRCCRAFAQAADAVVVAPRVSPASRVDEKPLLLSATISKARVYIQCTGQMLILCEGQSLGLWWWLEALQQSALELWCVLPPSSSLSCMEPVKSL